MFVVVVFFEAKPEHRERLQTALLGHAATTLEREPGCRRYEVAADPIDGASFLVYEVFVDEAAFKAHRELPHYAEFAVMVEPWTAAKRVLTYTLLNGRDKGRAGSA